MYKRWKEFLCKVLGHDWQTIRTIVVHQTKMTELKCKRCDFEHEEADWEG